MKKITLILSLIFLPFVLFAQQCPAPVADAVQYFCSNNTKTLNDLNVTAPGTLTWYSDAAGTITIPGTTVIVNGTTYYVSNVDPGVPPAPPTCTESDLVPITVYLQSIHFDVSPASCIDLGNNVFLIDPADIVTINLLDIAGNPITGLWTPVGAPLYIDPALANKHFAFSFSTLYFGNPPSGPNHIPDNVFENNVYEFTVKTAAGGLCPATTQKFTILTGSYIYDNFCFGATTTLDGIGVPGDNISWFSDDQGANSLPGTTVIVGDTTYYAGFNDPSCPDLLPVIIKYKVAPPTGSDDYSFCTAATWLNVGIVETDDKLKDLSICGRNLKWYNSALTLIPNTTVLVDGTIYYVTQTVGGCESEPLEILVTERACACIKNANGTDGVNGYKFTQRPMSSHNTCDMPYAVGTPLTPGTTNGWGVLDDAVLMTQGWDPTLLSVGINHPTTSPLAKCSAQSFRINTNVEYQTKITTMKKQFIAGEVIVFDFSVIMQNPSGHSRAQMPFFQVNVYDKNNNIIESRCIVSDPNDCIFKKIQIPQLQQVFYTDWSCLKFNTKGIQGQPAQIEFIAAFCTPSQHFCYAYIDNLYVGDDGPDVCGNSSFGYLAIDPINATTAMNYDNTRELSYDPNCSLIDVEPVDCGAALPFLNPDFPFDVCGIFSDPISAPGNNPPNPGSVNIKIFKNGTQVGTSTTLSSSTGSSFCYQVDYPRDFVPGTAMYGVFKIEGLTNYTMNCGAAYQFPLESSIDAFKFCPVAACPPSLTKCTSDPTGTTAVFDLHQADLDISDNYDPALNETIVTYYPTLGNAVNKTSPIINAAAYSIPSPGTTIVYARLDFRWASLNAGPEPADCYDVVPLKLIAGKAPNVPATVDPLTFCADPSLTDYEFDLTGVEGQLLVNLSPLSDYTWDYFDTLNKAQLDQSPITDPTAYIATIGPGQTQTIWVRVEGPDGCFIISTFELIIYPEIVYTVPSDYELCDDAVADGTTQFNLSTMVTQMTNNNPNLDVTFHINQANADAGIPTLPLNYTNTSTPQTIFVRIEDGNDCYITTQFDLIVNPNPVAGAVNDMIVCDVAGTGTSLFDLTIPGGEIMNGQPGLSVRFYTSQIGANAGGTNQLTSPYTNTSNPQTIYYRLEDIATGCFTTGTVKLEVLASPPITDPITDYILCDNDQDGTEDFNLTSKEIEILNTIPATTVTITYHNTFGDANTPINPIPNPSVYPSTGNETIYFRVEFNGASGCYSIGSFLIDLAPPIQFTTPSDYELCEDAVGSDQAIFDFNTLISTITNSNSNLLVSFYGNSVDAQAGTVGAQLPLIYTNQSNPETIFVRIENTDGCFATTDFDLKVNPLPVAGAVSDMALCDMNGTGKGQFDLSIPGGEIMNGQNGLTVRFYNTQGQANAGGTVNQLPTLYTNTSSPQTIYYRLEDDVTGCFNTGSFKIEVIAAPVLTFPIADYKLCDNDQDGTEIFDLTSKQGQILNTIPPASVTVTYHNTAAEANVGLPFINPANAYPSTGNETIYVRVEFNGGLGCFSVGEFRLRFHDQVAFNAPAPLIVCDTGTANGMAPFDLTTATTQISGNNFNLNVTYYLTNAQAIGGAPGDRLPTTFTNTVPFNQTIYVRIVNQTTGCYAIAPLDLQVEEAPTAIVPAPLTYCDEDNDGLGSFILTDADAEITGGVAGVTVTYHVTLADANNNVQPLSSPFYNTVLYSQIIYARVASPGVACFNIVPVELKVLDSPQTEKPDDLVACDFNSNGTGVFDLTDVEPQLMVNITNPGNFTIAYYATLVDIANNNPIPVPGAYTSISNPQTIYVIVGDINNACQTQEEFEIHVVDMPQLFPPDPLELCDINNPNDGIEQFNLSMATQQITNGDTSISISYYATQANADSGTSALPAIYTNQVNNQTIYIRAESADGCVVSNGYTLTLIVNPLPTPRVPDPLEVCDPSSDGFSVFNLEDATQQIKNGEPNTVITYHSTLSDAKLGIFPLASPYANIVAYQQTVYARSEFTTTGCFNTVALDLIVHDTPAVPVTLPDIVVCSDDQTDTGILFDLTENETVIFGLQNPALFTLTYHESEQNAIGGVLPIVDPANYLNITNPQDIWVRLGNPATECGTVRKMTLRVELAPEIGGPFQLELCDDDMFTEFDLTVMDLQFNLGARGMEVKYFETENDAQQGVSPIDPADAYTNTSNPQTIYVRLLYGDTGCTAYSTLTLIVNPNPDIETPEPIELCDVNGDGFMEFDLSIREADILNGEIGTVTYHLTELDAENNTDPILDYTAYTNVETPEQIIYVRVTNDVTGCYSVVELLLIVHPLPVLVDEISDYLICEIETDGRAVFDLTTKIPEILDGQDPLDFDVKFYEDRTDADNGISAIVNPNNFTNTVNPQEIFVRIENGSTECFVTGQSFFLRVLEGAEAFTPLEILEACEDELGTGIGTFDLTQLDNEILGGQDAAVFIVTYYEDLGDAETGDNPIADPTDYQGTNGTIYGRVTNIDSGCYAVVEIQLNVIQLPLFGFEDTYRLCVDAEGNAIMEESGEASPPLLDTGLSDLKYVFIWKLDGQLLLGETSSSLVVTEGGIYSVTVVDMDSGCEITASTTVTLSSPPLVYSAEVTTLPFSYPHTIEATASGLGTYVFQLDNGPSQASGTFTGVEPGNHTVTISDVNGCGSVVVEVGAIDYPMFVTPNGDGYHDTWNITGIEAIPTAKIYIFDRHGKLLKQLSPTGPGWDGTFNGNPMPSSDYWFQVIYTEGGVEKEFKGHFTLKR